MKEPIEEQKLLTEKLYYFGLEPPPKDFWPRLFYFAKRFLAEAKNLNLTAQKTIKDLFLGPVAEALFLARHLPKGALGVDLGSGAGIPGLIVKLARPDLRLFLVEALPKRVAFMEEIISALKLEDVKAISCHVGFEECGIKAPLALARGYGSVEKFIKHAHHLFGAQKAFYLFRKDVEEGATPGLPLSLKEEIPIPGHQTSLLIFGHP